MNHELEYIKTHYNVPAKIGGKVKFQGEEGVITGTRMAYLKVKIGKETFTCHPTSEMEYL